MTDYSSIIVEGKTDEKFLEHFCVSVGLEFPEISGKGGLQNILDYDKLRVDVVAPDRNFLGIIFDANYKLQDSWSKLSKILSDCHISIPSSPNPDGTIVQSKGEEPHIGIWVMPNNRQPGELEDFIAPMIPKNDPVWSDALTFLNKFAKYDGGKLYKNLRKSIIQGLLKTREYSDDATDMSQSSNQYFKWLNYTPLCKKFEEWLENLINL